MYIATCSVYERKREKNYKIMTILSNEHSLSYAMWEKKKEKKTFKFKAQSSFVLPFFLISIGICISSRMLIRLFAFFVILCSLLISSVSAIHFSASLAGADMCLGLDAYIKQQVKDIGESGDYILFYLTCNPSAYNDRETTQDNPIQQYLTDIEDVLDLTDEQLIT